MADDPGTSATEAILFDLKALTHFSESGPNATILAETGVAQVVLLAMRAGQVAQDIRLPCQIITQCLRGRAEVRMISATQALRAGLVVLIEAGTLHTFIALTDCVLLLTITPSPEGLPAHDLLAGRAPLVRRTD
jgi:quercetin dioxygenase-like cupin family protein